MSHRILPILAVSFSVLSGSTSAEQLHCSEIQDRADRDACYAASSGASKPRTSKSWVVAKSKSADSVVVVGTASREVRCAEKVGTFSLALMCKEDRTSLYVSSGCKLGETGEDKPIALHIDEQDLSTETLTVPRNTFVLSLDDEADAIRVMKSLLERDRLEIGIAPQSGAPFVATFELAGLDQKIKPLRDACSW